MLGQRLPMRQVREVLRLKPVCGHSGHQIAAMVGVSRYTVAEYLRRAGVLGITWPVPAELDDAALERKLFTPTLCRGRASSATARLAASACRTAAAWGDLLVVWEEYRAGQPDGYGYSHLCDLYAAWRGHLSTTMRNRPCFPCPP
jgi:transposase